MGTFAQRVDDAVGGIARAVRSVVGDEKYRYHVQGQLCFVMVPGIAREVVERKVEWFRWSIVNIDKRFPWRTELNPTQIKSGAEVPESIHHLSPGEVVIHNFSTPEHHVWFRISTFYNCMSNGRAYAYEVYLANIAEELSKRGLPAVDSVRSNITITSIRNFKVQ